MNQPDQVEDTNRRAEEFVFYPGRDVNEEDRYQDFDNLSSEDYNLDDSMICSTSEPTVGFLNSRFR